MFLLRKAVITIEIKWSIKGLPLIKHQITPVAIIVKSDIVHS